MKNPLRFFRKPSDQNDEKQKNDTAPTKDASVQQTEKMSEPPQSGEDEARKPDKEQGDSFTQWCRSRVRGGIERRERNDIFEEYGVYGVDGQGRLLCRYYHRYPEHERDFEMSYERVLSFDEFNTRLLGEIDRGSLTLETYGECIEKAQKLSGKADEERDGIYEGFSAEEEGRLRDFCETLENLKDKSYRHGDGIFRCEGESILEGEVLDIWFRKPVKHDAFYTDVAGIIRQPVSPLDIGDIWILSIYNRIRERCGTCEVVRVKSEWSLKEEAVYMMAVEGLVGIKGTVLIAVAEASNFGRFGFYALGFANK